MGNHAVALAIVSLHVDNIEASRGYPGGLMPHITKPVVAVNIHSYTPEETTVVAEICAPMNLGVYACEDMAKRIYTAWTKQGATVNYGGHKFDGKSGLYQMSVYGHWPNETETTEET